MSARPICDDPFSRVREINYDWYSRFSLASSHEIASSGFEPFNSVLLGDGLNVDDFVAVFEIIEILRRIAPGDRVVNTNHEEPDEAVVIARADDSKTESVSVIYTGQLDDPGLSPGQLASHCDEQGMKQYSYAPADLEWAE